MQVEDALANIVATLDDEEVVDDELRKELLHQGPIGPRFELLVGKGHVLGSRALAGCPASETVKMRGAQYESNGYDMTAATLSLSSLRYFHRDGFVQKCVDRGKQAGSLQSVPGEY